MDETFHPSQRCIEGRPQLLILDNHNSHLSVAVIDMAVENGVTMLTFPPHCSHRMQPLDVTVFGPVKSVYKRAHERWMKSNAGTAMQIMQIPMFVAEALRDGATISNIMSGFKATGIWPFNDNIFQDTDFIGAEVAKQNKKLFYTDGQCTQEEQRRIVIDENADLELAATETVSTTDESTPGPSHSSSVGGASRASTPGSSRALSAVRAASEARVENLVSILDDIGPVQKATPKPKSNRGPKPGKTTILTSPENVAALKEKQLKRKADMDKKEANRKKKQQKKQQQAEKSSSKTTTPVKATRTKGSTAKSSLKKTTPAKATQTKGSTPPATKRKKRNVSSSSEDDSGPECDGCGKKFQEIPTRKNAYWCMNALCDKIAHQRCVKLKFHCWHCKDCDSDDDL